MEQANSNATGAENYYIHSQFAYMLNTYSASSFQEIFLAVDAGPHNNLCSQVCTARKTTHCFCRKEVSTLEQGRQKNQPPLYLFIKLLM